MLSAVKPGNSISCLASTQARSPLPPHTPAAPLVTFFSRKYPHETEHVIIDKMGLESANHEIGSRFREKQHFNAVLGRHRRLPLQQGLPARILSPVYPPVIIASSISGTFGGVPVDGVVWRKLMSPGWVPSS